MFRYNKPKIAPKITVDGMTDASDKVARLAYGDTVTEARAKDMVIEERKVLGDGSLSGDAIDDAVKILIKNKGLETRWSIAQDYRDLISGKYEISKYAIAQAERIASEEKQTPEKKNPGFVGKLKERARDLMHPPQNQTGR